MSKIDTSEIRWQTIGVKRERTHEGLINRLSIKSQGIFTLLKDLMVFAAMVGYSQKTKRELKGETIGIILETYASDHKDGFIYLIAMLETEGGTCLR